MNRALKAEEAGRYLAEALGLIEPFSPQTMWQMSRKAIIPSVRIGRRVFFLTDALDAFIRSGGTASISPPTAERSMVN